MDAETRVRLHNSALAGMRESRPRNLLKALHFYADEDPISPVDVDPSDFHFALLGARPGDDLLELWRRQLARWDVVGDPEWSSAAAKTDERRANVFELLGLNADTAALLDGLLPITREAGPTVIGEQHVPWYTDAKRTAHAWYWPRYEQFLLENKRWPVESVAGLDEATTQIVQRLADPTAVTAYQSKGLVVGYVQSGKTANFTGVIAKALDAGYRLVVVLGGTLNLLRDQTQRRLDMELVGRENILRGTPADECEYAADPAWAKDGFIAFGGLPSESGGFDIYRMTTHERDYERLLQGIVALEAEKHLLSEPLYDSRNLYRCAARLMVVKKNKDVLTKLVNDLKLLKTPLADIPALIIDDESDEASVNTKKRTKPDADRTAINDKISELLRLLPRAQYIGYTATPYANVFIDPSDAANIFPKDFLISLPRPSGYMGAEDFHDLDSDVPAEERNFTNSNEKAFVRDIGGDDGGDDDRLREAIDMFVLAGAMKLYRQSVGDYNFRHHTMLIHESRMTADHSKLADLVEGLWLDSGYSGPIGRERLKQLYHSDLAPVSDARTNSDPVPKSFDELAPFISNAVSSIGGDDQPVIVVNSNNDIERGVADFDKRPIWKILVGGQKLSRGFTVEGLTTSYCRRRTNNASTLMQMGRWFGFRHGYRDLVRLYIGRSEGKQGKEVDLYEAFEAICLDEEQFRAQLAQYALPVDGEPQITPAQVVPLVSQRLPWLKPTAPNKMYNAQLVEIRSPGIWQEPTAYPTRPADLRHNTELWKPILASLATTPQILTGRERKRDGSKIDHSFSAFAGLVKHADLMAVIRKLAWNGSSFEPNLEYLEDIGRDPSQVDDWLVLAPQHTIGHRVCLDGRLFSWFERKRRREPLFGVISSPRHRPASLRIAGSPLYTGDIASDGFTKDRRGVVVLYPIVEQKHRGDISESGDLDVSKIVMAFCFVAPATAHGSDNRLVRFRAIDSARASEAIIPRS